jgi:hypothetical protein
MINFIRWINALLCWVFEPRSLWLCVVVLAISLGLAFVGRASEARIRLIGLFLQLGGVATIAWGLRETRRLFGYPTLFQQSINWAKRFPKYRPLPISGAMHGTLPSFNLEASGYAWQSFDPGAPIEKRVAAIEANLKGVDYRLNQVQQRLQYEARNINSKLDQERALREEEDLTTRRRLELSQTGGLSISAVGLVWLFLGLILSTASPEIMKFIA